MSNATSLSRTIDLPSFRVEQLEAALTKLGKKAVKLDCKAPTATIVKTYTVDVSDDKRYPQLVERSEVRIDYEIIRKAGDYVFLGKVEAADEVNGVPRNRVNGVNLSNDHASRYVTSTIVCEHCNIKRKRSAGYIVQNASDNTLMVGSSCLEAYTGTDPAAAVAGLEFANIISEIGSDEQEWGYGSSAPRVMPLAEVAAATLSLTAKNGFVNAAAAEYGNAIKTGNDVVTLLLDRNPKLDVWRAEMSPTAEQLTLATEVVKSLTDRILPAYLNAPATLEAFDFKVGISLNKGYVTVKDAQLVAAAVYYESLRLAKSKNAATKTLNEWLPGVKEGDKVELVASVVMVKDIQTMYGNSRLVKLLTEDGYAVTTFTSGNGEFTPGAKLKVKGSVKKLEDGKYGKQTMLTRVKVVA